MRAFKTLKQLFNSCEQLTAQNLINGRAYIKGLGWSDFEIENRDKHIAAALSVLGGRNNNAIQEKVRARKTQHWGLNRIVLECYPAVANGRPFWSYCAGQDYAGELASIKKDLIR